MSFFFLLDFVTLIISERRGFVWFSTNPPCFLASEVMESALVAEGSTLVLMLVGDTVGFNIPALRERHAILFPRLTKHLFGNQHFSDLALIVLASLYETVKVGFAAKSGSAHSDKVTLYIVGGTEAKRIPCTTGSLINGGNNHKLCRVHISVDRVDHARIGEREDVVVGESSVVVSVGHVRVECGVGGHCSVPSVVPLDNLILPNRPAYMGEIHISPHSLHN